MARASPDFGAKVTLVPYDLFNQEMRGAALAGGADTKVTRLCPGCCEQIGQIAEGAIGADGKGDGAAADHGNRREVLFKIIGQAGLQHRRISERPVGAQQQRIAIGRRLRDRIGADHAARPGAVFHNDRLAQERRHAFANHARLKIRRSAGRERHDDADGPIREGRAGWARQQGKAGQGKRGAAGDGHGRNPQILRECCPFCAAPGTPCC